MSRSSTLHFIQLSSYSWKLTHSLSLSISLSRGSSLSLPRLPSRERPTAVVWRTIERWCYVKVNFLSSVQCKSIGQTRCKAKTLLIYPAQSVIYFKLHIRKIVTGVVGANSREWVLELYHLYFGPRWYIKSRLRTQIHIYMFINLDDTRSEPVVYFIRIEFRVLQIFYEL